MNKPVFDKALIGETIDAGNLLDETIVGAAAADPEFAPIVADDPETRRQAALDVLRDDAAGTTSRTSSDGAPAGHDTSVDPTRFNGMSPSLAEGTPSVDLPSHMTSPSTGFVEEREPFERVSPRTLEASIDSHLIARSSDDASPFEESAKAPSSADALSPTVLTVAAEGGSTTPMTTLSPTPTAGGGGGGGDGGDNTPPNNIVFHGNRTIAENVQVGQDLGYLTATDAQGDNVTFSTSNPAIKLEFVSFGNYRVKVQDPSLFDYETSPNHQLAITVVASDGTDTAPYTFTFDLTNVYEGPLSLQLSNQNVLEGAADHSLIGNFITDGNEAFTYEILLSSDPGFEISGNGTTSAALRVWDGSLFDYETSFPHAKDVVVRATDRFGNTFTKTFTIQILEQPEAPHGITFNGPPTISENPIRSTIGGTSGGFFDVRDDVADIPNLQWSVEGVGADFFEVTTDINGHHNLITKEGVKLDYESTKTIDVRVVVRDPNTNESTARIFTIAVQDLDDNPPVIAGVNSTQTTPDTSAINPFSSVTIGDADNSWLKVTVKIDKLSQGVLSNFTTGTYDSATGTYAVEGHASDVQQALRALVFDPTDRPNAGVGAQEITTFTITATDGLSTVIDSGTHVTSEAANRAPTLNAPPANILAGDSENTNLVTPFSGVTFGDTNLNDILTVTIGLDGPTKGVLTNLGGGSYDSVTGIYTVTGVAGAVQAAVQGLQFNPADRPDSPNGSIETTTFSISVKDAGGLEAGPNTNIKVGSIHTGSPVIGGADTPTIVTVADTDIATPFKNVTITDDSSTVTVVIKMDTAGEGTFQNLGGGSYNGVTGIYTISGTTAQVQAAIQALQFNPADRPNAAVNAVQSTTFTISVTDGVLTATNSNITVDATASNRAPTVNAPPATYTIADNESTFVATPFLAVSFGDSNANDIVTVRISLDVAGKGVLSNLGGGSYDAAAGVYTVTGTVAAVQGIVQALWYNPTDRPSDLNDSHELTTFSITVTDAGGLSAGPNTNIKVDSVHNNAANTAPVIGGAATPTTVTVADTALAKPFSNVTITDDSANVTVTIKLDTASEGTFQNLGGGTYNAATGTYTITGATAQVQAAIQALEFDPADRPNDAVGAVKSTTFTITAADAGGLTATNSNITVNATAANRAPTVNAPSATYTIADNENTNLVVPFGNVTIGDTNANDRVTVTITLDAASKGVLSNLGGGSFEAGTGTYTVTGTAAAVQTAIRGLKYNPADRPSDPNDSHEITTFTIRVTDTGGLNATPNSNIKVDSVHVNATNAAPVIGGASTPTTVTVEDTAIARPFSNVTITDDSADLLVTIKLDTASEGSFTNLGSGTYNASAGTYTVSGTASQVQDAIRALEFNPVDRPNDAVGAILSTNFTITAVDGGGLSATNSNITVNATASNRTPTISAPARTLTIEDNENTQLVTPFSAVAFGDTNAGDILTVTIRLDTATKGALSNLGGGTYDATAGIYTVTGAAATVQAAVRALKYNPTDRPTAADDSVETTTFTINVVDAGGLSTTPNSNIKVDSIHNANNTAPVIGGAATPVTVPVADTAVATPFANVTITDDGPTVTATVRMDTASEGTFLNLGAGTYIAGTGTYTITGAAAQVQAAIQALQFNPVDRPFDAVGAIQSTNFTITVTDSGGLTTTNTNITVDAAAADRAPTLLASTRTVVIADNENTNLATPFSAVTFGDTNANDTVTVRISLDAAAKGVFSNLGGGSYNTTTGVYTITGTVAAVQAAVQALKFNPIDRPLAADGSHELTTFSITITDLAGLSAGPNTAIRVDSVHATNMVPVIGGAAAPVTIPVADTELATPFANVTISDDSASVTLIVTMDNASEGAFQNLGAGTYNAAAGTYTITGTTAVVQAALQALQFNPTDRPTARVGTIQSTNFTIKVTDSGGLSATNSNITVDAAAANGAPVLVAPARTVVIADNENTNLATPFANVLIGDPNFDDLLTVKIKLDAPGKGTFSNLWAGSYDAVTGEYTITAHAADVQTAVRGLKYNPTDRPTAPDGSIETTTFSITVSDAGGLSVGPNTSIKVDSVHTIVNAPPVISHPGGPVTLGTADNALINPFVGWTIMDDSASVTVTVAMDAAGKGAFENLSGGTYDAAAGTYTVTGTAADVTNAIRALMFNPTDRPDDPFGTVEETNFTVSVTDSGGLSAVPNSDITVAAGSQSGTNHQPTDIFLSGNSVAEGQELVEIGTLDFEDQDLGDYANYSLDSDAGGRFFVAGDKLMNLVALDYESADLKVDSLGKYYEVVVRATDRGGTGLSTTKTFKVYVTDVKEDPSNITPIILGADTPTTLTIADTQTIDPFKNISIFDPDSGTLTVTITLDNANEGVFEHLGIGTYNAQTGVYTVVGSAADVQAAVRGLIFNPSDRPSDADGSIQATNFNITVSDGNSSAHNSNITVNAARNVFNAAPTITVAAGTETTHAMDKGLPVFLFRGLDLSDADNDDLTVTISFWDADGVLANTGSVTGDVEDGYRKFTFTGKADILDAMLRGITFNPRDGLANNGDWTSTFSITVKDTLHPSVADHVSVVTGSGDDSANLAPVLTIAPGTETTNATDNGLAVFPLRGLDLSDADNDDLTVTISFADADGVLANTGAATSSVTNGIRTFIFTGKADALDALLRGVSFNPTDDSAAAGDGTTSFNIAVQDATHAPTNAQVSVVTHAGDDSANLAPVLTIAAGTETTQATDNGLAVFPLRGLDLSDADNDDLTVTISFRDADGVLANTGAATSSVTNGIRTFIFTGKADALDAILHAVTFNPTDNSAMAGNVTTNFAIAVQDVTHGPVNGQVSVVTHAGDDSANMAPMLTIAPGTETTQATDNGPAVFPLRGLDLTDVDNDDLTVTISFADADGVLANTGAATSSVTNGIRTFIFTGKADALDALLRGVSFNPTDESAAAGDVTTTFNIAVQDATHAPTNAQVGVVTSSGDGSANLAPVLTIAPGTETTQATDNGLAVFPLRGLDLSDADNDDLTVTLSFRDADGVLANTGNAISEVKDGIRTFIFTGKADALDALLRGVTFNPTDDSAAAGAVTTNFAIAVRDAIHAPVNGQVSVVTHAGDDSANLAPVLTIAPGTESTQATDNGLAVFPLRGLDLSDADNDDLTVTISFADADGVLANTGAATSSVTNGIRTFIFTGKADALDALLRGVTFNPTDGSAAAGAVTTAFAIAVQDATHVPSNAQVSVVTHAGDDSANVAPVLTIAPGTESTQATDNGLAVFPLRGLDLSDADNDDLTVTLSFADADGVVVNSGNATSSVTNGIRTFIFTGKADVLDAVLRGVTFNPTDDSAAAGDVTTAFTIAVQDATHAPSNAQVSVVTHAGDDSDNRAPVLTIAPGTETTQATDNGLAVFPLRGLDLSDADNDDLTVTISFADADGVLANTGTATSSVTNGVRTFIFTGKADALDALLRGVTFNPTDDSAAAGAVTTNFAIAVQDASHVPVLDQVSVVTHAGDDSANMAPMLTIAPGTESSQATDNGLAVFPLRGLDLSDADNDDLTVTISFRDADGVLANTGNANSSVVNGIRTFIFTGKADALDALLRGVSFNPTDGSAAAGDVTTNFAIAVQDVTHAPVNGQVSVVTHAGDDSANMAPMLTIAPGTETTQATDNGLAVFPLRGLDLTDVDDDDLTVTISFADADGVLANTGNATSSVTNGIRTFIFTGKADALDALLRGVSFNPTDGSAAAGDVTTNFAIAVQDATHIPTNAQVSVVTHAGDDSANLAPVLTIAPGTETTQATDNGLAVFPLRGLDLSDADDDDLTVTLSFNDADGVLDNTGNATSSVTSGIRTFVFIGKADVLDALLRGISFDPTDNSATAGNVTTNFAIAVQDATHAPTNAQVSVVTSSGDDSANLAPVLTIAPGTETTQATDNGLAVFPLRGLDLTDADNDDLMVTISFADADGVLANTGTATSSVTNGIRTFVFTGKADALDALLRGVSFNPTDGSAAAGDVTTAFTIAVQDATHAPVNGQVSVVTHAGDDSANLAPTIAIATGTETTHAMDNGPAVLPFMGVDLSDQENDTLTVTISFADADGVLANTGTATSSVTNGIRTFVFTGKADALDALLRGVTFNPTDDSAAAGSVTTAFTITVQDQTHVPSSAQVSVITEAGSGSGNAPLAIVLSPNFVGENLAAKEVGTLTTIDQDLGDTFTYMLVGDGAGGRFDVQGDKIISKVALDYESTDPLIKTDYYGRYYEVTVRSTDQTGLATDKTIHVYVADAADDPSNATPVIGGADTPSTVTIADTATVNPFAAVTFADADSATLTVTIALDTASEGAFDPASLGGGSYDAATGVYTITGTAAVVQAAVRGLIFNPTDRPDDPAGTVQATNFSITVSDGNSSARNTNITVDAVTGDTPPDQHPTDIVLGQNSFREFSAVNTFIGGLSVDHAGNYVYKIVLIDGAGNETLVDSDSKFRIDSSDPNAVKLVTDTRDFDFEVQRNYQVKIRVMEEGHTASTDWHLDETVSLSLRDWQGENITIADPQGKLLLGGLGKDTLIGGSGDDTLGGGGGTDRMEGKGGSDVFRFDRAATATAHRDTIVDFVSGVDKIQLSNAMFKLGSSGALSAARFVEGSDATTAGQRLIYDKTVGKLYYDADGNNAGAKVEIATFLNKPAHLVLSDFLLMA